MSPEERSTRLHRIALTAIVAAGLALRLGWGLTRPADAAAIEALPDQVGYLRLAERLLRDGELSFVDERFGQRVYAVRTPGYPLFLAACGADVRVARAVQAAVDASAALAVFLLARRWIGGVGRTREGEAPAEPRGGLPAALRIAKPQASISPHGFSGLFGAGEPRLTAARREPRPPGHHAALLPLAAAALVAFNPFLVYFSALLLTETLFTAILAWAIVLMTTRRGAWPWLLGGMALLALSIHVRPSGLALPALLGAAAAWVNRAKDDQPRRVLFRSSALAGAAGAALAVLVLLPWAWRNARVFDGRWVWSTTNDGITAYDGFHPGATGASDQRFVLERREELTRMGELGRNDYFAAEARRLVRQDPGRAAWLAVRKTARTWSPVPLSREFGGRVAYVAAALLFSVPFDVLIVAGLVRGRLGRSTAAFLLLPALYFTLMHALSVGSLRYRVPAEPPLAVVAAAGVGAMLFRRGASDPRGFHGRPH